MPKWIRASPVRQKLEIFAGCFFPLDRKAWEVATDFPPMLLELHAEVFPTNFFCLRSRLFFASGNGQMFIKHNIYMLVITH